MIESDALSEVFGTAVLIYGFLRVSNGGLIIHGQPNAFQMWMAGSRELTIEEAKAFLNVAKAVAG